MDLKKKDVADLLSVSVQTIDQLISEGALPTYTLNGEKRFNRQEIEEWMLKVLQEQKGSLPFGEAKGEVSPWQQFGLYRAIHKGDVICDLEGKSKEEIINSVMYQTADRLGLDAEAVSDLLLERESLMPTALNNGIAVPHTRELLLGGLFDAVVVVFLKTPIDWGALDNEPVHTLFFLFACDDKRHLNLLAKIAHFVSSGSAKKGISERQNKIDLLENIKSWEKSIKPGTARVLV